jgi:hypothetical protein
MLERKRCPKKLTVIHQNRDKYFGHAQKIGRAVSIKTYPAFLGVEPQGVLALLREVKLLAANFIHLAL